jgi:hypothetical protein
MNRRFTPTEYADIRYIYGVCYGNSRAAADEYRRSFLNRRSPNSSGNTRHRQWERGAVVPRNQEHATRRAAAVEERRLGLVQLKVCLLDVVKRHRWYGEPYRAKACIVRRLFSRWIMIVAFTFASGCLYIAGFIITLRSAMKQNSVGMELTIHDICPCGPMIILTGPLNAVSNIDTQ